MTELFSTKRVGLALSGGVARGPAHIGVLNVLLSEGIPIDYVGRVPVRHRYVVGAGVRWKPTNSRHRSIGVIARPVAAAP
jgi:hypothetical protein